MNIDYLKALVLSKIMPPITAPSRPDKTNMRPIIPIFSFSFFILDKLILK